MSQRAQADETDTIGDINDEPNVVVLFKHPTSRSIALPYMPFSDAADHKLQELNHHYQNKMSKQLIVVGPRQMWLPFAVGDEAQFHATMFMSAAHLTHLRQSQEYPYEFFFHRAQAIRTVNERLGKGMNIAATDGTINAVCCFANIENLNYQPKSVKIHMDALFKLVEAAGGSRALGMSGLTRRLVFWVDLAAAIALEEKPRFKPVLLNTSLSVYFGLPSPTTKLHTRSFVTRLQSFTGSPSLSEQAGRVFWALRSLSATLEAILAGKDSADSPVADDIQFSDRVEILERYIHPLWYIGDNEVDHSPVFRLFAWAALMYIYTNFRHVPTDMPIFQEMADRIKTEIGRCPNLNVIYGTFPDMMLWVLFLGGAGSQSDKIFFAKQASRILIILNIEDEKGVPLASQTFLWPEKEDILTVKPGIL